MTAEERRELAHQLVPYMRAIPDRTHRIVLIVEGHRRRLEQRIARLKAAYAGEGDELSVYIARLETAMSDLDAAVEELELLNHEARQLATSAALIEDLLADCEVQGE